MWQITWDELDQDEVRPITEHSQSGSIAYRCGICGEYVGLYGPHGFHVEGWLIKRDRCKNGHVVDWTTI